MRILVTGGVGFIGGYLCEKLLRQGNEVVCVDNFISGCRKNLPLDRIFNVYGPRMRKHAGCIIADLIQSALMNEPLRIHENGLQSNGFCYVDDMVDGLILLMNQGEFLEPIGLGSSETISLAELAKKIVEISKSSSIISQTQDSGVAFPKLYSGVSFTAKKLGFKPKINIDEGLKKTIEYIYIGNLKI